MRCTAKRPHGRDADVERALEIALAAQKASVGLDSDRSKIYCDLIVSSLGEAARQALKKMDARKYEFQSDFARQYIALGRTEGVAEGRAEGEARGRAALILRQLACRFGVIDSKTENRVQLASIAELDAIGDRLLTARTLQDALGF